MKEDMQQTSDIALKVTNVSKSFKLPTEKSSSLKNSLFNLIRGVHGYTIQEVLKDISFEVHKGRVSLALSGRMVLENRRC